MKCNLVIRAVTIAGLLAIAAASAVAGTPIRVSFRDTTVASGTTLSYPIYVDSSLSGYTVQSYQLRFTYNTTYFSFIGATAAGTITPPSWGEPTANEVSPGTVNLASAGSDTVAGTGKLVILQFAVKLFNGTYGVTTYFNFQSGANSIFNEGTPTMSFRNGSVTSIPAPLITISPNIALLTKGDMQNFGATGGTSPYRWSTTAPSVASIDSVTGSLTALSAGFAKVVVRDSSGYRDTSGTVEVRAFKLSLRDTSCYQGQTIDVPVYCTDLTGLGVTSGQFQLTYNQNVWTPISATETGGVVGTAADGPLAFSASNGVASISFAGSTPVSGSGVLLYVRLKASAQNYGYSTAGFQNGLFNQDLTANASSATLNVQQLATLTVNPTGSQTIVVGDSLQFTASGGVPPYTWSVGGTGAGNISPTGWFKPTASGIDTVKATDAVGGSGKSGLISIYDFRLNIPDSTIAPTGYFEVPVQVTANSVGILSYELLLRYTTSTFIRIDSIDFGGTLSNGMTMAQSFHGDTISIAAAGVNRFYGSGTLLKLRFRIPDSTTRPSNFYVNVQSIRFNEGVPLALPRNATYQIANGPIFSVTSTRTSFSSVVGQTDSTVFTVYNTGTASLTSTNSIVGSTAFSVSPAGISVLPADSAKISVYFHPTSTGPVNATVRFSTNDSYHSQVNIAVSGVTPYPVVAFSFSSFNFGTVKVGKYKDTTITISNTGTDSLKVTSIAGSNPALTARPSSVTILPGHTFVDTLRFAPTAAGAFSGRFSFTSNSLTSPDTVGAVGSGIAQASTVALSVSTINFGIVSTTGYKDSVVTISNNGTDTLSILSITSSNGVFSARPLSRTVPPGQSFNDTLRFSPTLAGGYSGRIFVTSNAPSSPDTITVSGTGHAPFPIIGLSSTAINFGGVKVGSFKDTTITISNNGTDTLKISSVTGSVGVFTARPATETIPPGQSASDTLRFAPNGTGGFSGRFVITSNTLTSPDTISVSGTGNPATDVNDPETPSSYSLDQNYPNPFNPSTVIRYGLRSRSTVRLVIFNILGQKVDELVNGDQNEGYHVVTWNPSAPSGVYFCRIDAASIDNPADHFTQIRKMILMK